MFAYCSLRARRHSVLIFFLLASVTLTSEAVAQSPTPNSPAQPQAASSNSEGSVAAAARQSKTPKPTQAKRVFTDEDMEASAGPLPRLKMEGAENADEVVTAIGAYKASHTPEQTEKAVHIWYDRYDDMLAAAIQENLDIRVLRDANASNGYELCQESGNYEQCRNRQMAEQRGARNDQIQTAKNVQLEVRIQHAFGKVRNGLNRNGLQYDWFKTRTTNGIDVF
jgi:hypothetical protein